MEPFADMICELKVDIHCETCKMTMMEVLSSISGVYSVTIDAQGGKVKVAGQVDPNILLRALARTDRHAELIWVKLKHPQVSRGLGGSSYYHNLNHGDYLYGPRDNFFEPMGSNRYGSRGPSPWAGSSWYDPDHYHHYPRRSPYVNYPFSRGSTYNFGPYNGPRW